MEEPESQITTSQENLNIGLQKRRYAINITSNPGYNVNYYEIVNFTKTFLISVHFICTFYRHFIIPIQH